MQYVVPEGRSGEDTMVTLMSGAYSETGPKGPGLGRLPEPE